MAENVTAVVSRDKLEEILNEALVKYDSCEDCVFDGGIMELRQPDESGCNWSDNLIIRCSGRHMTVACARAVLAVLDEVRRHYNIKPTA